MRRSRTLTASAVALAAAFSVVLIASAGRTATMARGVVPAQAGAAADYLPLAVGNRWELRARSAPDPMVLEVTGRDGDAFRGRWANPFVRAEFRFVKSGQQVRLTGLDMGQGMGPIPEGTVYWDFGLEKG